MKKSVKLNTEQSKQVRQLLQRFNHSLYSVKENKVFLAPSLRTYIIEASKENNNIETISVKVGRAVTYTLEIIGNVYVFTRDIVNGSKKSIILEPEDIDFINQKGHLNNKTIKDLAYKIDTLETRFGL